MIQAVFGSNETDSEWALALSSPGRVLVAETEQQTIELLQAAEHASVNGSYAVVVLTYEAAAALDSSLVVHSPTCSALAWAAIFSDPQPFPKEIYKPYQVSEWTPAVSESAYSKGIESILKLIGKGATYQVNYSFPMSAKFVGNVYSFYLDLMRAQGARYSAFLDLGEFKILSLSPELFFERKGRRMRTKPMKGTIGRGRWREEDQQLAEALRHSPKDQAENVMIVDLLRNDLGKISETGSVNVSALFELERFETLWQMTSTVESTLKEGTTLAEIFAALFPCGSITGAPKISTMKIINQLEPFPRGIYTGTVGFLRPGGDCIFNVAIRTILLNSKTGTLTFGVGGGITADSTAESEYNECLIKSAFLTKQQISFQLIETMLLDNGYYFLRERHLNRLSNSAKFFGFRLAAADWNRKLEKVAAAHSTGTWRVRFLLSKDGTSRTESSAVELQAHVRRVALAPEPIDSSNRMLFHKTTERDFFQTALATCNDCDDVVFWNENGEVTEASNANVVLAADGELWTPPITSGLLAGTFRAELLAEGKIKERVISVEELRTTQDFFLINSVQKWMKARLRRGGCAESSKGF